MSETLRHRGPDGCGIKVFGGPERGAGAALAHRRLSIIDLSEAGRQPMSNEDDSVWLTFNGEIYNFRTLRDELVAKGHAFRSRTDSEVILHLYEELGPSLVRRLNGIFAFAILDLRGDRLVLARDHIGVKPLYYRKSEDGLAFASEIKALLTLGERPEVNAQAVYDFFTYLFIPGPQTAFVGIQQLLPAHTLVYDLKTRQSEVSRYWSVRRLKDVASAPKSAVQDTLFRKLDAAVESQLVSDVPLGIFLSGGVDSSVLAGLASKQGLVPKSYTVDFASPELRYYSEAAAAETTSRFLGMDHRELSIEELKPLEMLSLIDYFDQPFGNPTFYLQWLIAKSARDHITVALSGAGGDELFAGYPRYRAAQISPLVHRLPQSLIRAGRRVLALPKDDYKTMRLRRMREFVDGLDDDPVRELVNWTYYLRSDEKAGLLASAGPADRDSERFLRCYYDTSPLSGGNRLLHVDVQTFLVNNLLEYTDRMSMAVGMEVRVPLLEPDFVEYALNVPFKWKLGTRGNKLIMRETFAALLSPTARRSPKRGFNVPLGMWMQQTLDSYFNSGSEDEDTLGELGGKDRGITWRDEQILNESYIGHMRREHRTGRQDLSHELFAIIVFDVWWRKYVSRTLPITEWHAEGTH